MEINKELLEWMEKFEKTFDEVVPLMTINVDISNEELISIIANCIEKKKNNLPEIFGYDSKDINKKY